MKDAQPHLPSGKLNSNSDKAEHGLGMPYDAERVAELRHMLRDARKRKLSQGLAARRGRTSDER